jgi:lipopolysaccharide export system protein LptC
MLKKTNITKDTADALLTKSVTENRPPSEQAKNKIWDEIKLVNPNADDITADFNVAQGASQAAAGASASATRAAGGQ